MHFEDLYQQQYQSYSRSHLEKLQLEAVVEQASQDAVEQRLVEQLLEVLQELGFGTVDLQTDELEQQEP